MFSRWVISPSKTLLAACLAVVAGTAAHAFWEKSFVLSLFLSVVICAAGAVLSCWRVPWQRFSAVVVFFFLLAVTRYDAALATPPAYRAPPGGQHDFEGTVTEASGVSLYFTARDVTMDGEPLPFKVAVAGTVPHDLLPGDRVAWRCHPYAAAAPLASDGDASPEERGSRLLLTRGLGWRCRVADVLLLEDGPAPPPFSVPRLLASLRARLRATTAAMLPETESSLLMGLLAGERAGLPPKLAQAFRDTGTTHVLAVSGYNVARVVGVAVTALALLALPRRRAASAAILAVVTFAAFVGAGASVVRAALMGVLALAAERVGRRYDAPLGLALAAAVMLLLNPLALRHDLGFQLSFLAVLGLHYLQPPWRAALLRLRVPLSGPLSETFAATAATMPLMLYAFGLLPVITPVANVIVAPLVVCAMTLGFVAVLLAACVPPLAPVFGLAAWVPLKFLVLAVTLCAAVPPWPIAVGVPGLVVMYASLAWYAATVNKKAPDPLVVV